MIELVPQKHDVEGYQMYDLRFLIYEARLCVRFS